MDGFLDDHLEIPQFAFFFSHNKLTCYNIFVRFMLCLDTSVVYHYTNLTFVCPSVSPGGYGKPFDPS